MEKQKGLEGKISEKNKIKGLVEILNPFKSARSYVSNRPFPLSPRTLYGIGFAAPFPFIVGAVGTIGAGLYGAYILLEKYLF